MFQVVTCLGPEHRCIRLHGTLHLAANLSGAELTGRGAELVKSV